MIWLYVALLRFPLFVQIYSLTICVSCGLKASLAMSGCFVREAHFVASQDGLRVWASTIRLWSLAPSVQSGGGRWRLGAPDRKHWAAPARMRRKGINQRVRHWQPCLWLGLHCGAASARTSAPCYQKPDPWSQRTACWMPVVADTASFGLVCIVWDSILNLSGHEICSPQASTNPATCDLVRQPPLTREMPS